MTTCRSRLAAPFLVAVVALPLMACAGPAGGASGVDRVYHFRYCQSGAAADCVPGDNASAGTSAAPKRDLSALDLNRLPAGTTLLFARGGAWSIGMTEIQNPNSTAASPLRFA